MRNLVFFMHATLDGFVAGVNGELNWASLNDEIFDFVDTLTAKADAALYGRVTYELMESYWPTAAQQPHATKHDKNHAAWYKNVAKIVLSRTLRTDSLENTIVINENLKEHILQIKQQEGKDILIFGSPRASHSLLKEGLIDEFWIFVNPVLLGQGKPLFSSVMELTKLKLLESKTFSSGVVALHYQNLSSNTATTGK
jgi:dihydrofolate reductase